MGITYELAIDGELCYFDTLAAAQAEACRYLGTPDEEHMRITVIPPRAFRKMSWTYAPDAGKWLIERNAQ